MSYREPEAIGTVVIMTGQNGYGDYRRCYIKGDGKKYPWSGWIWKDIEWFVDGLVDGKLFVVDVETLIPLSPEHLSEPPIGTVATYSNGHKHEVYLRTDYGWVSQNSHWGTLEWKHFLPGIKSGDVKIIDTTGKLK